MEKKQSGRLGIMVICTSGANQKQELPVAAMVVNELGRIYSGHHNLPIYEMSLKSDNVEFVRHCGGHFENGDR
jgi:hypothetical protein